MHRTALILLACLCATSAAGAGLATASTPGVLVPLPLFQPSEPAEPAPDAKPQAAAPAAAADPSPIREIVAGVLTGSLAAVLTLKLLYGRRRRDGSGPPSA